MARDPHPFFVPIESFDADSRTIRFPDEEAHHILRVIRLRAGDECRVTDGRGGLFRVVLEGEDDSLRGRILDSVHAPERATLIEIGFPVLRLHARGDWLIEKAVEVGADVLIPIPWERSLKEATESSRRRWERIAREAMKQSERVWLPEVVIDRTPFERKADTMWILADPQGDERVPPTAGSARVRLLIGPEGGITERERERVAAEGATPWGLGPARLRAETAAIVGIHRLGVALRTASSDLRVSL